MNDNWNSESPYSMSVDGNGNYFGEATISIVYTEKVEEILLNTVIINSNENWGYVKDLTTNEIHTGTNITVTGPNTEKIDLMIYSNEGYHIASVYDDFFGEDVGPFTQYPCGLEASVGSNTQTYTYEVTYAKNEEPEPDDNVLLVYKFDNTIETINNYLPLFVPDTFNYTYEDVIKGNIITRTIYSDTKPTQIYIHGTANETVANSSILDVLYVNINGMTTLTELFAGLTEVQKLDVSNFDISNVTDIKDMFHSCKSLISLDVSNFNTGNVADMSGMFSYCEKLISLDLSNFDTSNVTTISRLAKNCTSLESINLSNWNLNNLNYNSNVFYSCDNLVNITMQNSDYNSVNKIIAELPTRTSESPGTLNVTGVYDFSQVDITTAESKCWNVINEQPEESKTQNLIIGDEIINELFIGEQEIKEIYLGNNLLFKK